MRKPPWWWPIQPRDAFPVVLSVAVLLLFLMACTYATAHIVVAVMAHIRHAWNHPS